MTISFLTCLWIVTIVAEVLVCAVMVSYQRGIRAGLQCAAAQQAALPIQPVVRDARLEMDDYKRLRSFLDTKLHNILSAEDTVPLHRLDANYVLHNAVVDQPLTGGSPGSWMRR